MKRQAGVLALLLSLAVCNGVHAAGTPVTVGLGGWDIFPFHRKTDQTPGADGLEPQLMTKLCALADLECEAVVIDDIDDRVGLLANGTVDIVIATFSVTPERAEQVRFVPPYYYSAGVALFSDSAAGKELEQAISGGRGIPAGTVLCGRKGYYALDALKRDMPDVTIVEVATVAEGADSVEAGKCAAYFDDSTNGQDEIGMRQLDVAVIYQQPYGVAIAKEAAGTELERKLVWVLVKVLEGGADSTMAQLESDWVVANGGVPNKKLPEVTLAVDSFSIPANIKPEWMRQRLTTGGDLGPMMPS